MRKLLGRESIAFLHGASMSIASSPKIPKDRLFPKGFWDRPKLADRKTGDPTSDQIHLAVGQALSAWETAEESFASLFQVLCQVNDYERFVTIGRVFGAIPTTYGRVSAALAAAEVYFGRYWRIPEVQGEFRGLAKEIQLGGDLRNEIAHGKVLRLNVHDLDEKGARRSRDTGALLVAPAYITGRTSLDPPPIEDDPIGLFKSNYRFNAADISRFASKFLQLGHAITDYLSRVVKDPETKMPRYLMLMWRADPEGFARKIPR